MIDMELQAHWRRYGKWFGYPLCCVEWFCVTDRPALNNPVPKELNGLGYVSCPRCRQLTTETLLATIAANRKCPTKFPHETNPPWSPAP